MTFDKQSNTCRTAVESKSNRSCNYRIRGYTAAGCSCNHTSQGTSCSSAINGDENRQFSPPTVNLMPPLKGFPWNLVSAHGSEETRMIGLPDGRKSFKIGLAVLIQYRRVTDTQPASHPATSP